MANLPESSTFDAGVYQIETTDPVVGGPSGVSNAPLKNLANRTKYLKDQVDAVKADYVNAAGVSAKINAEAAPISHVGAGATAHALATTSAAGFMSPDDKARLNGFQPGQIGFFGRSTAPTGWLKCNGASLSRVTYADLFAAIGTTFGAGDGVNTFNLPDARGEFLRGWDDSRGIDAGRAFGSWQKGTLVAVDTPSIAVWGISTDVDGEAGLSKVGADIINYSDYPNASLAGTSPEGGAISLPGNSEGWAAGSRPRNIAFLTCIKY